MKETRGYRETSEQAEETGRFALAYILMQHNELPQDLRGLDVYGVVGTLREHDELLHGEKNKLSALQRERLEEVEAEVEDAIEHGMQFYPYGHREEAERIERIRNTKQKQNRSRSVR